jgi:hypothetical protein
MSEGHGDPSADVRAFLPRPGEPVEQYAERLRGLHRDLSLVLQAVERGLESASRRPGREDAAAVEESRAAASEEGEEERWGRAAGRVEIDDEPVAPWDLDPAHPVEIRPVELDPAAPAAPEERGARPLAPRIEIRPAPSGERRRVDGEERREVEDEARAPLAQRPSSASRRSRGPSSPRPPRFPSRPSAAGPDLAPREPAWVEPGDAFTAAQFPAAAPPARLAVQPLVVVALVAGWLTVVALLVALLVS